VAGIITSVSLKTTKNGDRMAFFTLEDQSGELECIAFSRQFSECAHLIRSDLAVCASGSVSLRDEESPKVLINRMEELIENGAFRESDVKKAPIAGLAEARDNTSAEARSNGQAERRAAPAQKPTRLFLRLPERDGHLWKKAENLAAIFEGSFPVSFYDAATKQYAMSHASVTLSDYLLRELRELLGEENIILK